MPKGLRGFQKGHPCFVKSFYFQRDNYIPWNKGMKHPERSGKNHPMYKHRINLEFPCSGCGITFNKRNNKASKKHFCSIDCYRNNFKRLGILKIGEREKRICKWCKNEFTCLKTSRSKYCNQKCSSLGLTKYNCTYCGDKITKINIDNRGYRGTCKECRRIYNSLWNTLGTMSTLNKDERKSLILTLRINKEIKNELTNYSKRN
jgi:hypothetical protein